MTRVFTIFLLLTVAAVSAVAQCSDAATKALLAFHHAFEAAYASADKATLMATFADDFVTFPQMTGKAQAIDAAMRTFERNKANPPSWSLTRDRFIISCTSTTATITHRVRRTSKGEDGKERTNRRIGPTLQIALCIELFSSKVFLWQRKKASERGGSVALVDGGRVWVGWPGAPGCTTIGPAGSCGETRTILEATPMTL